MNTPMHSTIKGLFRKYAAGKLTAEELSELRERVNQTSDPELMPLLREEWEEFKESDPLTSAEKELLFAPIRKQTQPRVLLNWRKQGMKIAASIAILFLTSLSVYLYTSKLEMTQLGERNVVVKVGKGERVSVTLPDGTNVRLNSESVLSYQQDFGLKDRKVHLTGEGFFDVTKSEGKHFMVNTHFLDILVLGTSFNVYTYEGVDLVEMALVRGNVQVTTVNPPHRSVQVKPNEKIIYNKRTGEMQVEATSNLIETAWVSNELVFRSSHLKEVFNRVGRKYGVKFEVEDENLLKDLYTGVFDETDVANVMTILQSSFGFKYQIKEDIIRIYATKK